MTNNKNKKTKSKGSTKAPSTANREIARLTKLVENSLIKERNIRLSPLGKMAFDGANTISNFFGAGKIFGSGAYKMAGGNTTWDTTNQVPVMHSGTDVVRICHREYLGQINSSSAFTMQRDLLINPGLPDTFPYLSTIANAFQEYKFKGLVFEFKSTSADALNSTNTALGALMMVAQYRADAPSPTTKLQMMNEAWSTDTKPSQNTFLPIECNPKESPLGVQYIRSGPVATTQDVKFYDLAQVFVATQGSQATADIGELWVTYDVELYKPVLAASGGPGNDSSWALHSTGATTAIPLGVSVNGNNGYDFGLSCVYDGVSKVTFPSGLVGTKVQVVVSGSTAGTITRAGNLTLTGLTALNTLGWAGAPLAPTTAFYVAGSGTSPYVMVSYFTITADIASFTWGGAVLVGATTMDVSVSQLDFAYT